MKGYFKAPNTGDYKFSAFHDDGARLYISEVLGSAERPASSYWSVNGVTGSTYWQKMQASSLGTAVPLTAGDYVYMELYHINTGGAGYIKLNAEIVNTDATLPNQVYQVT